MTTKYPILLGKLKDELIELDRQQAKTCRTVTREHILQACTLGIVERYGIPETEARKKCEDRIRSIESTHTVTEYNICEGDTETGLEQVGSQIIQLRDVGGELVGPIENEYPVALVHVHPSNNKKLSPADIYYAMKTAQYGASAVCVIDRNHIYSPDNRMTCVVIPRGNRDMDRVKQWLEEYQDCIDKEFASGGVAVEYYKDKDYFSLRTRGKKSKHMGSICYQKYVLDKQDDFGFVVLNV